MELSVSLQKHLEQSASLHRRLCPRQVLGVRMARFACTQLEIDPALHRKRMFVYMENGHCLADGVIAVTCASPTNQLMQLLPYGKMAGTFLDLQSGNALRVWENPQCREAALEFLPGIASEWKTHLLAYQSMPDDALFYWKPVRLLESSPVVRGKYSVICSRCGDRVHERAELDYDGTAVCRPCLFGAYYQVAASVFDAPSLVTNGVS